MTWSYNIFSLYVFLNIKSRSLSLSKLNNFFFYDENKKGSIEKIKIRGELNSQYNIYSRSSRHF